MQEYEWGLAQYLGAGVAACYRGLRIYDTEETKALVKKWVHFYKVDICWAIRYIYFLFCLYAGRTGNSLN